MHRIQPFAASPPPLQLCPHQDHALVSVLHQLMHRQGGVVGLHHGVGNLGGGHDGEGQHHAVRVLLADLGDEQGTHARASATTQGVADLEACRREATGGKRQRMMLCAGRGAQEEEGTGRKAQTDSRRCRPKLTLQAVAGLSLLANNIQHAVNQLSALSVVPLGPVVTGTSLAKHKVVRAEDLQGSTRGVCVRAHTHK